MALRLATLNQRLKNVPVSVISAKFCGGAPRTGSQEGPQFLLDSSLQNGLQSHLADLVNFQDVSGKTFNDTSDNSSHGMKSAQVVSAFNKELSAEVNKCVAKGSFPLTLGGDHSIAIGTLTGVAKAVREAQNGAGLATVWFDAHADINKPETSPSGYLHGMPVAFASGLARHAIFDWIQDSHLIDLDKFVYIGLRDVDEAEWRSIAERGIKVFDMRDVERLGIEEAMDQTLQHIGKDCYIHLSFDIDGLDPSWAPSTGFPVDNGFSLPDGCYVARRLYETSRLIAMDLVEINPSIASDGLDQTLKSARTIIYSALGLGGDAE